MAPRLVMGIRSFRLFPEVVRAVRDVGLSMKIVASYLRFYQPLYPLDIKDKNGHLLTVYDFEDLTTLWAVWCADEYRIPSDSKYIIDLGANIGAFTLLVARVAPEAKIISVEPFPSTFEKLATTVQKNSLGEMVCCENCAIEAVDGTVFMDGDPAIKSHSRKTLHSADVVNSTSVPARSLLSMLESHSIAEVDYLKADIEGAEVSLFTGTDAGVLRRAKRIGVECHSEDGRKAVWDSLSSAGFSLERISRSSKWSSATTAEFVRLDRQ